MQMTIAFTDDNDVEHQLPSKFEVCPTCEGHGSHSQRFGAIAMEDFMGPDWDDESREDYMSGRYDETCGTCRGQRVVAVVDEQLCPAELLTQYQEQQQEIAECDAIQASERRAELWAAGERD